MYADCQSRQSTSKSEAYLKSPLNYIGGKYKTLGQIIPLFPDKIGNFVDLFAGGCNVGINIDAENITLNDNLIYLIELYKQLQQYPTAFTLNHIYSQIAKFELSKENDHGYKCLRECYNEYKNPLDLLVLISYSFNHQIRFNNNHKFNNPFGRNRSSYNKNIERNLEKFINIIKKKKIQFSCSSFEDFDYSTLNSQDFVYCDPPYLITTGSYNDGKRGFKGWTEQEEVSLLSLLDHLGTKNIKFALSNVIKHKGKENDILSNWLKRNEKYHISFIDKDYSNSNYQSLNKNKNSSIEVLITNYTPVSQRTNEI